MKGYKQLNQDVFYIVKANTLSPNLSIFVQNNKEISHNTAFASLLRH